MERIQEKLDYNFRYSDAKIIDELMRYYISDRERMYNELFCSTMDYTLEDVKSYIKYFMGEPNGNIEQDGDEYHEYLYRLKHFLSRNYEMNLIPEFAESVTNIYSCLISCLDTDISDEDMENFESLEYESIKNLKTYWADYLSKLIEYPMLNLDKMNYANIAGVQVYYNDTITDWVLNTFLEFVQNIKRDFPSTLLRMDTFVLVSPEYITFCGGEGTEAFFTDDAIFYADSCPEEDREFYRSALYHEFGHFIYSLLSETYQIYWCDNYIEWKNNNVKMTRDEDKNSQKDEFCEELFADCTSCHYLCDLMTDEDYIHNPSNLIMNVWEFIIKKEFV